MDMVAKIFEVLPTLMQVSYLIYAMIGVFVGLFLGALPGLSASMAVALLLPLALVLQPLDALCLFMGIYKGGLTGGAVSGIAFGMPGSAESAPTTMDGYALARQGKARKAISMAFWASTCGDLFSNTLTLFFVIPVAGLALAVGPREMFWVLLAALFLLGAFAEKSMIKTLAAAVLGLLIGLIGEDPVMGVSRLAFGVYDLQGGIDIGPLLIGIFAMTEVFRQFSVAVFKSDAEQNPEVFIPRTKGQEGLTFRELLQSWRAIFVGCSVGTVCGAVPGPGATVAAFISYALAKKVSRRPELFGKGSLEGVAAPEAGNNATCGPNFVPLLVFGIPGSAMAALFAGAFMLMGITPAPLMIQTHPDLMVAFLLILMLINPIVLVMGLASAPLFARVGAIDNRVLFGVIFIFCLVGGYTVQGSLFDVWVVLAAGALGFVLNRFGFSRGAFLLGFIVGPMMEGSLRLAMVLSLGNPVYFLQSNAAVVLAMVLLASIVVPIGLRIRRRRKAAEAANAA